jgi:hypothetical protein
VNTPEQQTLRMYGQPSGFPAPSWVWVADQLAAAGIYWVIGVSGGHPHPRPVWGLWQNGELFLSLGSPALRRSFAADPRVTVHLESGTDVVILEGVLQPPQATTAALIAAYKDKYDWDYQVDPYGDLLRITPSTVIAWRAGGVDGRESFKETGRWDF